MYDLTDFKPYHASQRHGVYALFLKENCSLSPFFDDVWCRKIQNQMKKYSCQNLLYIGKAEKESLSERIETDHHSGRIRISTLRFTISYCAGMQLYLCEGNTKADKKKRKIEREDEQKITNWISKNTQFRIIEADDCETIEKEYLKKFNPPFNIDDCPGSIIKRGERRSNAIKLPPSKFDIL